MKKNILLIGFMGVGKGSTARAFSKKYGVFNIDTDDIIESMENREIKRIFEKKGEKYFRKLEQKTADWIECCVDDTLISCGGGFYMVNNMKKLGHVVFLDASFEWIYNRLKNAKNSKKKLAKRPLFSDPDAAMELYEKRKEAYLALSNTVIDLEIRNLDEVLSDIAAAVGIDKK